MATAEFDAGYVYDAACKRIEELNARNKIITDKWESARQKRVDKFVTYRCGFLWLKTKTRTRAEAEKAYKKYISERWGEWPPRTYSIRDEAAIARLANAVLIHGETPNVTLTAADCRAIGIPAGFEVPA